MEAMIEYQQSLMEGSPLQAIDASISPLAFIKNLSATHAAKIKRLTGLTAESAPFEPNISALEQKLNLGRDTVNIFLYHLERACLLNLVNRPTEGVAALQKPDKVYLQNTSLSFALNNNLKQGTIRETVFLSQLRNAGYQVQRAEKGETRRKTKKYWRVSPAHPVCEILV